MPGCHVIADFIDEVCTAALHPVVKIEVFRC
jgi:hypothetical protein